MPAVAYGERVVATYADMASAAASIAAELTGRYALSPGDRVAVIATNHVKYLETLFAIWWAGMVAVPIDAKLHPSEIRWIVEASGARILFLSPDIYASLAALSIDGAVHGVCFEGSDYRRLVGASPASLVSRAPTDLAWLFYTSGTTGRPKGAMLSHRNLAAMSFGFLTDIDPTSPGDCLLHAAPMSHGTGLIGIPHVCRCGLHVIPESGAFDASEALALFRQWPRISMFAAPTMIRRLTDEARDSSPLGIRTIIWGGAAMAVSDAVRAIDAFGPCFAQLYGQGETPMTATVLSKADISARDHPKWLKRLESAGIANSAVEVRVGDAQERPLSPGESGEVLVRGETVMSGYWDDTAASKAALRNGWLHTGDIGVFDESGYLYLKDRAKDLIISGGANIYPREVEEILISHPHVAEACVIGRADPEWGEIVVAYVVGDADVDELDRLCVDRIARFKRPRDYVFVPELPKNSTGKILKADLRALDKRTAGDRHRSAAAPGA
jgi:long-chain acyl-CoA synthetase